MSPSVIPAVVDSDPQVHETEHVHAVYDQIASHFSSTRYKPWPIIAKFIASIPTGWIGLDSGTGNGKYLPLASWTVGLDRSRNLLKIAQSSGGTTREVVWGDVLSDIWRHGAFDYAISIATIHHLASEDRRMLAVKRLLQTVSPRHGRVLIYVWAVEQDELSTRKIPEGGTSESTNKTGVDVFVPWTMTGGQAENAAPAPQQVFNRYYHMFAKGELDTLVSHAAKDLGLHIGRKSQHTENGSRGVDVVQSGWERSNYYVELQCWES